MRTPWKLLLDVMSKTFQEVVKVQRQMQMIQTMIHSKVQNMLMPDPEPTAAQSLGSMLQISSRRQTSLREREKEHEGSTKRSADGAQQWKRKGRSQETSTKPWQNSKRGDARVHDRKRESHQNT